MEKTNNLEKSFEPSSKVWSFNTELNLPLESSKRKKDATHFLFDLKDTGARFKESISELTISIAQNNPSIKRDEIKSIINSIKAIKQISKKDCILSTFNGRVLEIGMVIDKYVDPSGSNISFDVKWLANVSSENYTIHQKDNQKFQRLEPINIYAVTGESGTNLERSLANMGLDLQDNFIHEQVEYSEKLELVNLEAQKEEKGGLAEIFFATNRAKLKNSEIHYDKVLGNELIYGICQVSIPRGHVQGNLERPKKYWFYEFSENENEHITLKKVEEKKPEDFDKQLTEWIAISNEKAALIFIPGFNTTFEEAARRTGQLAWDIPFDGPTGFFSWPSSGSLKSYSADEEKSESSAPDFSKFLMQIINNTGVERLHIIAHSMGSRVLSFSLSQLVHESEFQKKAHIIQQLVLGAPDIDQEKFKKTILPHITSIGLSRTLYSSDKDMAMIMSHTLRGGRPRLGEAGASIFVEHGIDTIEVSNMPSRNINHNYIFETKELLIDLFYLLSKNMKPSERRLKAVPKGKLNYWLFAK